MVLMFPISKATSIGAGGVFPESGEIRTLIEREYQVAQASLTKKKRWQQQQIPPKYVSLLAGGETQPPRQPPCINASFIRVKPTNII